MALTIAKFVDKDANSLEANGTELRVKVDGSTIERTASGLAIVAGGVTATEIAADAVGDSELDTTDNYNFTGTLQYNGVNVADETYVNNAIQGLDAKDSVKVASTANLTLSGEQTIDGVLTSTDRVLVKDQSSAAENGIYTTASGAWSRVADADTWDEHVSAFVWVEEGTANGDSGWLCTVDAGGTLETTDITWTQFSGAGQITAGAGMTKSGNTLDVIAGDSSLTVAADSVVVNVDDSTIETDVSNGVQVKAGGIAETQLNASVAGTGLTGGGGSALSIVTSSLLTGGAAEIDGDKLDIDWTPSNYTPATTPTEVDSVDNLTAHLYGIDQALAAINERQVETFTLDGTDITNKYVTLASQPASAGRVVLHVKSGPAQFYGDDFQMNGGTPTRLEWTALALDGVLASGDKLTVEYDV